VSPLKRFQTTLFFVTSRALFPLLAASALVLVGTFALGGIGRGSGGPLSLALGLVGLELLLTLACLVVQQVVYLAEADRQEVAGILFGAGDGALTSFACARIYPTWDVGSLLVFAVARLALTECQQPHRLHAARKVALLAHRPAYASTQHHSKFFRRVVGCGVCSSAQRTFTCLANCWVSRSMCVPMNTSTSVLAVLFATPLSSRVPISTVVLLASTDCPSPKHISTRHDRGGMYVGGCQLEQTSRRL
jgi:hypothetical protein